MNLQVDRPRIFVDEVQRWIRNLVFQPFVIHHWASLKCGPTWFSSTYKIVKRISNDKLHLTLTEHYVELFENKEMRLPRVVPLLGMQQIEMLRLFEKDPKRCFEKIQTTPKVYSKFLGDTFLKHVFPREELLRCIFARILVAAEFEGIYFSIQGLLCAVVRKALFKTKKKFLFRLWMEIKNPSTHKAAQKRCKKVSI